MTKNQRKIKLMGLSSFGFTSDFNPNKYTKSWDYFQKYVAHKEASMIYQGLVAQFYKEEIDAYTKGGHKLSAKFRKEIKQNAKAKAKENLKAKLQAAAAPAQQGYKEQESVLQEG